MILHAGGDKWEISPDTILNVEAIMVKRKIGLDFQPWMEALQSFNAEAVTALVWIARKRQEPTVKFEDISFPLGSIDFELTEEEKAAQKEREGPKDEDEETTESE
jgi:hypothetical protein